MSPKAILTTLLNFSIFITKVVKYIKITIKTSYRAKILHSKACQIRELACSTDNLYYLCNYKPCLKNPMMGTNRNSLFRIFRLSSCTILWFQFKAWSISFLSLIFKFIWYILILL